MVDVKTIIGPYFIERRLFSKFKRSSMNCFVYIIFVSCLFTFLLFFHKFQIIQSQAAAKQTSMATWFKNLMDGVERNLLTKNRDK